MTQLRAADVQVVDLQTPFDLAYAAGSPLYPVDDGHWNALAGQLAAAKIEAKLKDRVSGK